MSRQTFRLRPQRGVLLRAVIYSALLVSFAACGDSTTAPTGVNGTWVGTLSQPNGAVYKTFDYSMALTTSETTTGTTVTGSARISLVGQPQYYGDFVVGGTLQGTQFEFTELSITAQVPPPAGTSWCLKRGTLVLAGDAKSLSGNWSSTGGCAPGTLALTRQ